MLIRDIAGYIEQIAPLSLQEPYDNSGLLCGSPYGETESALLCIDVTEAVVDEAINKKAGLIISHHPLIFSPIKKLTGSNYAERTLIKAIRNDVAVYAAHTNLDVIWTGVSRKMCEKLGLKNLKVLQPKEDNLRKLVFFVPEEHASNVREAIFEAGAGSIGDYDQCSFNTPGEGSFRGSENTDPFVGKKGELHFEKEIRVETIFQAAAQGNIIQAMMEAHTYEEVAYDIYPLLNKDRRTGMGMTGELEDPLTETVFLDLLKEVFTVPHIRHTRLLERPIRRVALCGGSGLPLLKQAIGSKSDVYVTADVKYHQFFDAEDRILLADIGHFESEQFTTEIIYELLNKKFPTFAFHFSEVKTNPINYY